MRVAGMMRDLAVLIWTLCVAVTLGADQAPKFTKEPKSTAAKMHSPVKLHCDAEPASTQIKWTLNNIAVETDVDRGIRIEENGRTLHILSFRHTRAHQPHVGQYRCLASNNVGTILSRVATLERAHISSFKSSNGSVRTIEVVAGNTAHLPCELPRAVPSAFSVFEVNSKTISGDQSHFQYMSDGSLQIGNVTSADEGVYKCLAINSVSHRKRSSRSPIRLKVTAGTGQREPVPIIKPPAKNEVVLGDNLTLPCIFHGYPAPTITWNKYGGQLPARSQVQLGNLVIQNVTQADIGTYLCLSENGVAGMKTEVAEIDVLLPPKVATPLNEQTVLVGGKATFTCIFKGHPKVSQMWYHDGQPVVADSHMEITNTTLTINNAQSVHQGMYQCVAYNRVGQTHSEARLVVKNASSMEGNGTVGEELLTPSVPTVEQITKTSVKVSWLLYPGPPVRVFVVQYKLAKGRWETAGEVAATEREFSVERLKPRTKYNFRVTVKYAGGATRSSEKTSLRLVKNVKHLKGYLQDQRETGTQSTGDLSHDSASPSTSTGDAGMPTEEEVIETTPRSKGRGRGGRRRKKGPKGAKKSKDMLAPQKPSVVQTSESSVLLQWVMPHSSLDVSFFKVQYREKTVNKRTVKWKTVTEQVESKTGTVKYEVTGLKPGRTYKFRIAVMFVNSNFKMSPVSNSFTLESNVEQTAPTEQPFVYRAIPKGHDKIQVQWRFPMAAVYSADGFFIRYRKYSPLHDGEWKDDSVEGRLERSIVLLNLEAKTEYEVQVQCYNNNGLGPFSNLVVGKTLEYGEEAPISDFEHPVDDPSPTTETDPDETSPSDDDPRPNSSTNTNRSNEMLYIVLGAALGLMVLFLLVFMVLCWRKQRQQNKMMADMDAKYRNKFQDPSQQIYNSQMGPKKHTNGFLLNGINGHANQNGRQTSPYLNGKMNINVNPITDVENQEIGTEDSDATKLAESSPEIPNGHVLSSPDSLERQRNLQNLQNILDTDDIAPIDYSNFMGTGSSHHSTVDRPQFTTFIGSQGHLSRPEPLANGSANGSLRYQNRSHDQLSANEQSQSNPAQVKHKRRKKRPSAQSRDQSTNTDISSNEGTLENNINNRKCYPPAPLNQNSRYANSYDCDD